MPLTNYLMSVNNQLARAITQPTTIDNIHESCFKSYAILDYVKIMLRRKDSHQTILELIETLYAPEFIREENIKSIVERYKP